MPTIGERGAVGKKLTILGYGPQMHGKTSFLKSIRMVFRGPCYIFNYDMEDNLLPLITDPLSKDIEYDQYDNEDGYDKMVQKLVALRKNCPYEVVVLENLNRFYKNTMEKVLKLAKRQDDVEGARQQDWGNCNKKVFARLKELLETPGPRCVYVTTHEFQDKDETTGRLEGNILIPGRQLPAEVPPMFNLNLHFKMTHKIDNKPEYWIQCASDNMWKAGDKTGQLEYKEKVDFVEMWRKLGPKFPKEQPKSGPLAIAATPEVKDKPAAS